jgi:hypothetical protein
LQVLSVVQIVQNVQNSGQRGSATGADQRERGALALTLDIGAHAVEFIGWVRLARPILRILKANDQPKKFNRYLRGRVKFGQLRAGKHIHQNRSFPYHVRRYFDKTV